jgi:RNA 2',3'-cyclic 3'-phosphodiesterase
MYRDDESVGPRAGRHPSALPSPFGPVFFALKPDPSDAMVTDGVSQELRNTHGLTCKPLRSDLLHMTLVYLGDIPGLQQATLDRVRHIAEGISARPFDITFDRLTSFPNPRAKRPFVLLASEGNAGLLLFHRELVRTMKNAGLVHGKPVLSRPHVTLVWDFASVREMPLDAAMTWTAREFFLIFSMSGQSHHECLGRWPLKG